jgi:hypothetical protein
VGLTGTGKSTFVRNLLTQFPKDWILKIVDGKYVEFTFSNIVFALNRPFSGGTIQVRLDWIVLSRWETNHDKGREDSAAVTDTGRPSRLLGLQHTGTCRSSQTISRGIGIFQNDYSDRWIHR